jgi:hypothetical protein
MIRLLAPLCIALGLLYADHAASAAPPRVHSSGKQAVSRSRAVRAEAATRPPPPGQARPRGPQATKPKTVTVAGRILLPGGGPAAGAQVFVGWRDGGNDDQFKELAADAGGRFSHAVRLVPTNYSAYLGVTAVVAGRFFAWRQFSVDAKDLGTIELTLAPGATAAGQLVRLDGKPAVGISLSADSIGPELSRIAATREPTRFFPGTTVLPPETAGRLFQARTDADGRFSLPGLPREGQFTLKLGDGLRLAPGSVGPIRLRDADRQPTGILVAVRPGQVRVRVLDRITGKPAANLGVQLVPRRGLLAELVPLVGQRPSTEPMSTDAKGEATATDVVPGDYLLAVGGDGREVRVEEGQVVGPLEIRIRQGALQGRVLDQAGRPVAKAKVTATSDLRSMLLPEALGALLGGGDQPAAQTNARGEFQLADFAWNDRKVTVRASRGNDSGEWTGAGDSIGATLELRLRPGAQVSVSGRLVDPARRPLARVTFTVIRWQDAPRIVWFAGAREGKADPNGRFRVDGLERGESFSLLGGSPFRPSSREGEGSFESPRFVTPAKGAVQDLGDVVVHPLEGAQQVIQLYGVDSPEQFVRLTGLMVSPCGAGVGDARQALERYQAALQTGDIDTAHRMTARASLGWADERREFLLQGSLRTDGLAGPGAAGALRPVRFIPRILVAYLLNFRNLRDDPAGLFNFGRAARDLESNPDWVFFAEAGAADVRLASVLRREQGEWRVVRLPGLLGGAFDILNGFGGKAPDPSGFARPAPSPDAAQREAARVLGERYLESWSRGRDSALLPLTSPLAAGHAATLVSFRKQRAGRADEGACPLVPGSRVHLDAVPDLTAWEAEWVANYALEISQISGSSRRPPADAKAAADFPGGYVKRGDLCVFRYEAGSQEYLMLLVRHGGQWQVLEPALPL